MLRLTANAADRLAELLLEEARGFLAVRLRSAADFLLVLAKELHVELDVLRLVRLDQENRFFFALPGGLVRNLALQNIDGLAEKLRRRFVFQRERREEVFRVAW